MDGRKKDASSFGGIYQAWCGLNENTSPDDRQLQTFLDSEPDPSQAGTPVATVRARRQAVAAVDDLRSTATVLGQALSSDYAARQRVRLLGQEVGGAGIGRPSGG